MTSREKFEAWAKDNGMSLVYGDCDYVYSPTVWAWKAWQAAETDMAVQLANAESKCRELAAENVGLKNFIIKDCHVAHIEPETFYEEEITRYVSADGYEPETPATAAFLAEVRSSARNEGINYAASRLAAAFNHGFVDKPLAEVCDVVRMILDTKEELANSTLPAADGISGEYAEKFLAEFAAQLRNGSAL